MEIFSYEKVLAEGAWPFCGVDEAGRGPLAGPVCAAAVILPEDCLIEGLNDSKKLTARRRDILYDQILEKAVSYGIAFASVEEIEKMNILRAALLAMRRSVDQLDPMPMLAIVDGNQKPELTMPSLCVVGGDGKCASVAAASILAKVTRDRLMVQYAEQFSQYGFDRHKGYATRMHYDALRKYGPCPIHRPSFLRKLH